MKPLRVLLIVSAGALLTACGGALNSATPFVLRQAQDDMAQGDKAASSARSHAFGVQNPAASGYKQIYVFKGTPDGASPYSGLLPFAGLLYGTTLNGSKNYCAQSCGGNNCYLGCGTVFTVDAAGDEQVVYNFQGNFNSGRDGSWPFAGLTLMHGVMFGTASSAGQFHHGVVYTIDPAGNERVIYQFAGGTDGANPEAPVLGWKSRLVGTTVYGGSTGCGGSGCGTFYIVSATGKELARYAFKGGSDGARVYAPVTKIGDKFYGTTLEGGQGCGSTGCGTIFSMTATGKEKVIYRFSNSGDGAFPNGLTAVDKVLYGTTEGGGTKNSGTFFSITPSGTLKTLYNFADIPDGNLPGATLLYLNGNFYGTTVGGGANGQGTVFKVTPAGKETVLYSFAGSADGFDPQGPVVLFGRYLYGTTEAGGGNGCGGRGCGTIFRVKP